MIELVLLRHGESTWNKENRFTGWTDVDLSAKGVQEAHDSAQELIKKHFVFDLAFTSVLKRAIRTLWIVLDDMDQMWIPVVRDWRLNERHYGALQGLNKVETSKKYGEDQVKIWRRSFSVAPPPLEADDERHPRHDRRYASLKPKELPCGESLKDTIARFLPFWEKEVIPLLRKKKRVLIVAHGNSLRALVKHLDNLSEEQIMETNIPTGIPLVYELDESTLKPIKHYYLGDEDKIINAINSVASQGKKR